MCAPDSLLKLLQLALAPGHNYQPISLSCQFLGHFGTLRRGRQVDMGRQRQ